MKDHTFAGKTTRNAAGNSSHPSSAGENAVALAPPAYGIDFVDGGMLATAQVQRVGKLEEEKPLQGKFGAAAAEPVHAMQATAANRTGMPDQLKDGIEALSGMDMSGVRVNFNSDKPARINALAYAQGNNIHLGPGQDPHLPHEAWHVVQQKQGRVPPTLQMRGMRVNADSALEREADVMGERAARGSTERAAGISASTHSTSDAVIQPRLGFEIEMLVLVDIAGRPVPEKTDLGTYGAHDLELVVDHGAAVEGNTPVFMSNANYDLPVGGQARLVQGTAPADLRPVPNTLSPVNWQANTNPGAQIEFTRPPGNNTTGLNNQALVQLDTLLPRYRYEAQNWDAAHADTTLGHILTQITTWTNNNPGPSRFLHPNRRTRYNTVRTALQALRAEALTHRVFWANPINAAAPAGMEREYRTPQPPPVGGFSAWGTDHPQGPGMGANKYASILEIVTPAYQPETAPGRADIIAAMTEAAQLAAQIEIRTANFANRVLLRTTGATVNAPGATYIGNAGPTRNPQTTAGSIQTTLGLDLAQLASYIRSTVGVTSSAPYLLKHHSDVEDPPGFDIHVEQSQAINRAKIELSRTPADATAIINAVGRPGMGGPSLVNLRGLLVLICQYLRMGKYFFEGDRPLDKNLVPLLSRTDLSHIYQHNVPGPAATVNTEQHWVTTNWAALRNAILTRTNRQGATMLFTNSNETQSEAAAGVPYDVDCATFINNIFTAASDGVTPHFGGFRQMPAEVIDPTGARDVTDARRAGAAHREGPVFELRNMIPLNAARFPRGSWVNLATYTVDLLRLLNARTEAAAVRDTRMRPGPVLQDEGGPW